MLEINERPKTVVELLQKCNSCKHCGFDDATDDDYLVCLYTKHAVEDEGWCDKYELELGILSDIGLVT